jgi:hypothetical protein
MMGLKKTDSIMPPARSTSSFYKKQKKAMLGAGLGRE